MLTPVCNNCAKVNITKSFTPCKGLSITLQIAKLFHLRNMVFCMNFIESPSTYRHHILFLQTLTMHLMVVASSLLGKTNNPQDPTFRFAKGGSYNIPSSNPFANSTQSLAFYISAIRILTMIGFSSRILLVYLLILLKLRNYYKHYI